MTDSRSGLSSVDSKLIRPDRLSVITKCSQPVGSKDLVMTDSRSGRSSFDSKLISLLPLDDVPVHVHRFAARALAIRKAPSASVESIQPRPPQPCEVGRRRKNRRQSHNFFKHLPSGGGLPGSDGGPPSGPLGACVRGRAGFLCDPHELSD